VQKLLKQIKVFFDSGNQPHNALSDRKKSFRSGIHWAIPGKLAIGGFPSGAETTALSQAGIKAVLSLCGEYEGTLPEELQQQFDCVRLVLPDSHHTDALMVEQLARAVEILHEKIDAQQPIYVHCLAGIERSPTVCIAYLCQYYHLELWEAVNWLKQAHPASRPTTAQMQVIREFLQRMA
jgi:protein-tyrosine phosphatase